MRLHNAVIRKTRLSTSVAWVSSPKAKLVEQPSKLAELFSKCSQLAVQEEQEQIRMVGTMLPVLSYLDEPVVLRPGALGDAFRDFKSVSLAPGAVVVTTDMEGRVLSKPLVKYRTEECLAILRDLFPELGRLVAEKRRAAQVKPALSTKAALAGSKFLVDLRSYRMVFSNSGGDCRELQVSLQLSGGRTKAYRPVDVNRGERVEVDLGVFKEVTALESIKLQLDCKDVDGRELHGDQTVRLDGAAWEEAPLGKKQPEHPQIITS